MRKSIVVAVSENKVIGFQNRVPWRLPADLALFKTLTMGHHIIMGRKTHESIGRPLPGRPNIIVTTNHSYTSPDCIVVHSLDAAYEHALAQGETEVLNIGGAQLFQQALPYTDRMYLSIVHEVVEGDTFFPVYDPGEWELLDSHFNMADDENEFSFTFKILQRLR